ncbi:MAG: ShlB/FhaC/HecB family hemolysin secretion/activation protein, partial [Gammaproteobacteria bacterium]|nr:ShlB/FhaC/HecB family hemolysin secretion/activation protein [Gammaproteobacteria bacterium]
MDFSIKRIAVTGLLITIITSISTDGFAGFLDMPDITEAPTIKRQSMLRDLDIPSVRDRNPDPESGPRLAVTEFRLQGIVEFPELGITRAALSKMVEDIRFDFMGESKLLESGYTQEELGEVSDLLVEIEDETQERHVSNVEVQKLVWLIRDQRSKRGITLGQIETIADKITNYYRERGFILAKAYIPEQKVRDGVVSLTLLLGLLGEVDTVNNTIYKRDILTSVFDDMLAKPVTSSAIEEHLYLINDFPGLNVMGFFEPGSQVGDTKLNINVKHEQRFNGNVRVDNHGAEDTGEYRVYAEIMANNPLGNADQLYFGLLNSFSPDNTTYYQFKYKTSLFSPSLYLSLSSATNQFVLDKDESSILSLFEFSGETTQANISTQYMIKRSRTRNYSVELRLEEITSDLETGKASSLSTSLDEKIENNTLIFNYDILLEKEKRLHQGSVSLTSGSFVYGEEATQEPNYIYLNADYTLLTFWTVPYFESQTRILLRSAAQFTDTKLSSISQFSLGGPTRARGYAVNQFS